MDAITGCKGAGEQDAYPAANIFPPILYYSQREKECLYSGDMWQTPPEPGDPS